MGLPGIWFLKEERFLTELIFEKLGFGGGWF
jgi:hypothetical protein